jgi:hypothetical protein
MNPVIQHVDSIIRILRRLEGWGRILCSHCHVSEQRLLGEKVKLALAYLAVVAVAVASSLRLFDLLYIPTTIHLEMSWGSFVERLSSFTNE